MDIQQQPHGAVTVVKPIGALVEADATQFRTETMDLLTRNMGRVIVDASGVPFVDSTGIEALADVTEELANGGRALKLCGVNSTIRQVLELTGWNDAFEFFDDVNGGVRSFL